MELTLSWSLLTNHFLAVPRSVVIPLSFLTEHMSDVVSVILFEFVGINFLCELSFPKLNGFFHGQA